MMDMVTRMSWLMPRPWTFCRLPPSPSSSSLQSRRLSRSGRRDRAVFSSHDDGGTRACMASTVMHNDLKTKYGTLALLAFICASHFARAARRFKIRWYCLAFTYMGSSSSCTSAGMFAILYSPALFMGGIAPYTNWEPAEIYNKKNKMGSVEFAGKEKTVLRACSACFRLGAAGIRGRWWSLATLNSNMWLLQNIMSK